MGCSPYFAITGAHPILPFDIAEATYLQLPPNSVMLMTNLISRHAIALQKHSADVNTLYSKVYHARLKAAQRFEEKHLRILKDFNFQCGSLVLMRNTQIEKSLNKKMRARYIGPLIVVLHNYGGAYILAELDGTVLHRPIATFHLLPYFARKSIPLPPDFIDIDDICLQEMEHSLNVDGDGEDTYQNPIDNLTEYSPPISLYFPLSFYHVPLSDISPFIPKTRYRPILHHARPLLHGSQGYDVT
jgi:hypothetical protein